MIRRSAVAVALTVATLMSGCSTAGEDRPAATLPTSDAVTGDLTVFAAASLKSTFTELGSRFETDHPGTQVVFNFAGSTDLAAQISQVAPADVFASADTSTMDRAVDGGTVAGDPVVFATNTLTIVTAPGNPRAIASFADLAGPGVQLVVCAPQVPCGSATEKVEAATGVTLTPVSEESAVTDVLGKVTSGQADAGLVYVTDAAAAGDAVTAVAFPEAADEVNSYPIAALADSTNPAAASAFIEFVTGPQGRDVLAAAGFGRP